MDGHVANVTHETEAVFVGVAQPQGRVLDETSPKATDVSNWVIALPLCTSHARDSDVLRPRSHG